MLLLLQRFACQLILSETREYETVLERLKAQGARSFLSWSDRGYAEFPGPSEARAGFVSAASFAGVVFIFDTTHLVV
jgi:hypothetical protein